MSDGFLSLQKQSNDDVCTFETTKKTVEMHAHTAKSLQHSTVKGKEDFHKKANQHEKKNLKLRNNRLTSGTLLSCPRRRE